eukprot:COSAG01_NODE_5295_length_4352_cov_7.332236_3_plen_53_part_00
MIAILSYSTNRFFLSVGGSAVLPAILRRRCLRPPAGAGGAPRRCGWLVWCMS